MAAGLQELRERAKALSIPGSLIRANMHSADQLQKIIASFEMGKAHVAEVKSAQKKGTKMAVLKPKAKKVAKVAKVGRPKSKSVTVTKRGRGRPKGSVSKPKAAATPKRTRKPSNGDAGRHTIGKVNFKKRDNWNPREGSATYIIFQLLKETNGDRTAVYNKLRKRAAKLFPNAADPDWMLKYRVSRTLFDFVVKTGQHEISTNRVEYGTGGTGKNGTRSKKTARKAVTTARKRGRPAGSKNRPKVQAKAKRGPGRPKGSKNKR